jgi:hypothetical protein
MINLARAQPSEVEEFSPILLQKWIMLSTTYYWTRRILVYTPSKMNNVTAAAGQYYDLRFTHFSRKCSVTFLPKSMGGQIDQSSMYTPDCDKLTPSHK